MTPERRARRSGFALLGLGAVLAAAGGVLLAVVLNVVPLDAVLPPHLRATGPVVADARATFWVALAPAVGIASLAQGAHQLRARRSGWLRFAALLALAVATAGVIALASR